MDSKLSEVTRKVKMSLENVETKDGSNELCLGAQMVRGEEVVALRILAPRGFQVRISKLRQGQNTCVLVKTHSYRFPTPKFLS